MPTAAMAKDTFIRRLERELAEKTTFIDGVISHAEESERDLDENEMAMITEYRSRVSSIKQQLDQVEDVSRISIETANRAREIDRAISTARAGTGGSPVEYRSAGHYAMDMYGAAMGKRDAAERLEIYHRAAALQTTTDEPGLIPEPIIGPVINFIDAARPIVVQLGARAMPPSGLWHRPLVTQHTAVGPQGTAGAAADEKTEVVSQKMTITRLTGNAKTYGGYVNVSRQSIDFTQPGILDIIITDLAAQYAIETEAATAAALASTTTTAIGYGATPTGQTVAAAVWKAAAQVYLAVRGQGKLVLACATDVLPVFGPLFAPYGPFNQFGKNFEAVGYGQGVMGQITGVDTVMSAGLAAGEAFLFSTAALEVYEQRVGTLQVVEPSVLGLQIAYAGYFTPLMVKAAGIVPLTAT
jgi:HK97 family phage major capsid protein